MTNEVQARDLEELARDQLIVGELLRRKSEYSLPVQFDLSVYAAVERYPHPHHASVYAYQFMRTNAIWHVPSELPATYVNYVNIATCIPDLKTSRSDWIQMQAMGGRPYAARNPEMKNLTQAFSGHLQAKFFESPMLPALPASSPDEEAALKNAQINFIGEMISARGVFATMRVLEASMNAPIDTCSEQRNEHPVG